MHSLPDLETLNNYEREHIEQVLQRVEQSQTPYMISPISKSRSAGNLEHRVESTQDLHEPPLSQAELDHISKMEAMIAESEAGDFKSTRKGREEGPVWWIQRCIQGWLIGCWCNESV